MDVPVDEEAREHRVQVADVVFERERNAAAVRRLVGRGAGRRRRTATRRLLTAGTGDEKDRERSEKCHEIAGGTHKYPLPNRPGFTEDTSARYVWFSGLPRARRPFFRIPE